VVEADYPENLAALNRRFSTEDACRQYLVQLRWPDGFRCPKCGGDKAWLIKEVLMECGKCGRLTSATAGTLFHKTRKPLQLWFQVIWWVVAQKNGASALGLQRVMGLGSYETAWAWLHKLRRAMVRPGRDQLAGEVEVDETFVGGVEEGGGRRHVGKKALVAVAAQVDGKGIGRIRLSVVRDSSADSLVPFVKQSIAPGSVVITDGLPSYLGLETAGYVHRQRVVRGSGKEADTLLPRVHRVAALLKRWLLGTHQGRVERTHLPYYLDEFTFRFNRRASRSRGLLFYRLMQQAARLHPVAFQQLVGGSRQGSATTGRGNLT
jgi:transposase-like protein